MKGLLAAAAVAVLGGAVRLASSQAARSLRMGLPVSGKALACNAAEKRAEHVGKATGGEYTLRLFPGQQIGSGRQMMQMLKPGTLDPHQGTDAQPTCFEEGPNVNVTSAPCIFRNQDTFVKFLDSPLSGEMVGHFGAVGATLTGCMGSRSPRAITTASMTVRLPAAASPGHCPLLARRLAPSNGGETKVSISHGSKP